MRGWLTVALMLGLAACAAAQTNPSPTVLMMNAKELGRGGNFFTYYTVSNQRMTFRPGDRLEYDIFLSPDAPEPSGGVDAELDQDPPLRDRGLTDQNGLDAHPKALLPQARGQWYHRVIPLDKVAGRTARIWELAFEGDTPGDYTLFIGDLGVRHADGTWDWIYRGGELPVGTGVRSNTGYSRRIIVRPVDRAAVREGADIKALVAAQVAAYEREQQYAQFAHDVRFVESLAAVSPDGKSYAPAIAAARNALTQLQSSPLSAEAAQALMAQGRKDLAKAGPMVRRYTGHLVGHGHIDPAWQWEWPETVDVVDHTFSQAIRFMDEFPGFTYSQSSSALYKMAQDHYPDLFRKMQERVKSGQWDIVGGRVTEADTNLISEESHARQFLLAQRYFRQYFGKTATVGWEPDTFGHTWSMPEILKMGGIESYYFGRGGQGQPLFWWEGPDGTRTLTFDEVASGSWYDSNLENKILDELVPWKQTTGTNDIMWVYGVGNHGGGPTREQLQTAETWMKTPYYPTVRFSAAQDFFSAERKQDLAIIPVIRTALDPHIDGCYTTHSEMKRLNRDAENWTATAETASTIASLFGQPYPKDRFDAMWYDICLNQHHDTLPGTGTHDVYLQSEQMLGKVVAEAQDLAGSAVRYLAYRTTRPKDIPGAMLAFNPLGWARNGEVRFPWPVPAGAGAEWVAVAPDGEQSRVNISRGVSRDNPTGDPVASFTARNVPSFGYRVYALRPVRDTDHPADAVTWHEEADSYVVENNALRVTVRKDNGLLTSLIRRRGNQEYIRAGGAGNRLEVWYEDPDRGDAWVIGAYTSHEALDGPAEVKFVDRSRGRVALEITRKYRHSTITQQIVLTAGSDEVELPMWVDWQEEGTHQAPTPFLKLACDMAGEKPTFRYEIPFAVEGHATDGREVAALKSAELGTSQGGVAILNDCKHGYSAEGNTLRLSLIRTPNRLDPMSDERAHFIRAALWPHDGPYGFEGVRRGFELNQPLVAAKVSPNATGQLPLEKSFVQVSGASVVPTVLKRAEEDPKAMIVRLFEADGAPGKVSVTGDPPAASTRWVNFVEDPLSPTHDGPDASADLHPYEIRTAELFAGKP